jgi:hypothetical protein
MYARGISCVSIQFRLGRQISRKLPVPGITPSISMILGVVIIGETGKSTMVRDATATAFCDYLFQGSLNIRSRNTTERIYLNGRSVVCIGRGRSVGRKV